MSVYDPNFDRLARAVREPPPDARGPADPCPPPDRLLDAAARDLPANERRDVLAHVAVCPACTVAWSVTEEVAGDGAVRSRSSRRARWLPLAAAATLAVGLLWVASTAPPSAPDAERRTVAPALDWSTTTDGHVLTPGDTRLRWSPGPPGTRYDVRVSDADLVHVAAGRGLDDPAFVVPPERLTGLDPGAIVLWQIDVILPDGTRVTSPTFRATWNPAGE